MVYPARMFNRVKTAIVRSSLSISLVLLAVVSVPSAQAGWLEDLMAQAQRQQLELQSKLEAWAGVLLNDRLSVLTIAGVKPVSHFEVDVSKSEMFRFFSHKGVQTLIERSKSPIRIRSVELSEDNPPPGVRYGRVYIFNLDAIERLRNDPTRVKWLVPYGLSAGQSTTEFAAEIIERLAPKSGIRKLKEYLEQPGFGTLEGIAYGFPAADVAVFTGDAYRYDKDNPIYRRLYSRRSPRANPWVLGPTFPFIHRVKAADAELQQIAKAESEVMLTLRDSEHSAWDVFVNCSIVLAAAANIRWDAPQE